MKKETTLRVIGMTCGGCEKSVERALLSVEGVESAKASYRQQMVTVAYNPDRTTEDQLRQAIETAGYQMA